MPTYEYVCANQHRFEQFQKISDPPVEACPQCGAPAERILSGGAGLLFKGSGFYITDYRSDTYRKAAESEKGGSEGGKSASGGESKGGGGSAAGGTQSSGGAGAAKAG